jgi:putative chitinase
MQIKPVHIQSACTTVAGKMRVDKFYPYFVKYFDKYGISTIGAEAMFLAQVMHESGEFRFVKELGSDKYLDKYDTGTLAARLGNTPEDDNDGAKFCGRGLIQITGLRNYAALSKDTGIDFVGNPELLEQPEHAVMSACWFWHKNNLGKICTDIRSVTRRINGGLNGLEERQNYWQKLMRAAI